MEYTKGEWKRFTDVYRRQDLHEVVVADDSELVAYTDTEANAHLIAAAPDMYGALKYARAELLEFIEDNYEGTSLLAIHLKQLIPIDEALAKAKGR